LITNDTGFACSEVDEPHNSSIGWAAVIKYNENCEEYDCDIDRKVHM